MEGVYFKRLVRIEASFEQRQKTRSHAGMWRKKFPDRENNKCRKLEVRVNLTWSIKSKKLVWL